MRITYVAVFVRIDLRIAACAVLGFRCVAIAAGQFAHWGCRIPWFCCRMQMAVNDSLDGNRGDGADGELWEMGSDQRRFRNRTSSQCCGEPDTQICRSVSCFAGFVEDSSHSCHIYRACRRQRWVHRSSRFGATRGASASESRRTTGGRRRSLIRGLPAGGFKPAAMAGRSGGDDGVLYLVLRRCTVVGAHAMNVL
ncbi:hypothetical protein ACLOJK_028520 [Asimina triloba]